MREGQKWKKPRQRKAGGGDLYIEESLLKDIRARMGENLEYSVSAVKESNRLIVKFRRAQEPK